MKQEVLASPEQKEIFILGTGPSLSKFLEEDFTKYKNSDFLAVNKFCLSADYIKLKPKYYIFADPVFFKDTENEVLSKVIKDVMEILNFETDWEMNIYVPTTKDKTSIERKFSNSKLHIVYYSPLSLDGPDVMKHYLFDRGIGMPFVGNVLIAGLMLAIRMGYKKISIVGADQSIHVQAYVNKNNQTCVSYKYFDGTQAEAVFWDDLDPTRPQKYHEFLTHWTNTFRAYHEVESFAKYKKCQIVNMTKDSYVDAFERG